VFLVEETDLDPTVVIGGRLERYDANAKAGQGALMLAEADESDGSFMRLSPTIAIVTNLDEEHLDHYKGGMAEIEDTFLAFMNKVPFYGMVIACKDDPRLERLLPRVQRKLTTYGLKGDAHVSAADIRSEGFNTSYELMVRGGTYGRVRLSVPGRHNVLNSLAAIAVGLEFDVSMPAMTNALEKFTGADRRFHLVGCALGRTIVDDYAHHPTEIAVTLDAARLSWEKRIVAVFQPHRYSRFQQCWDKFLDSFEHADHVIVTPVFPAGERPIEGVDSEPFAQQLSDKHPSVTFLQDNDQLAAHLLEQSHEGDLVMGLGAGNIGAFCKDVYQQWRKGPGKGKTGS
jgi:UDP-N-acetylmuramate--alanine ligase